MRVHNNQNSKQKKPTQKSNKRLAIYTTVLITAIAIIALAIILPLTLGGGYDEVEGPPPVVVTPTPTPPIPPPSTVLPLEDFELGKLASLNRLVFHSSLNNWRTHNGVNFNAEAGSVVGSIRAGTVLSVEHTQLEGGIVTIQHANGFVSSYHGLASDIRVEEGDTVSAGAIIGTVAAVRPVARGEGSHLHLRVRQNGNLIDPLTLFPELLENK